ncbi:MAG: hypothetical protein GX864_02610, partial [Mollicutes bacterium]|nr:hypothetical protein [Mollicutes bacterium]
MIKNNKTLVKISFFLLGIVFLGVIGFLILRDPNSLTSKEKKWLKDNKNVLIDVRIPNDVNTFGKSGEGVFFDYLNSFQEKYKLDLNIVTYSYGSVTPGIAFKVDNIISPNDILFYEDHFVLVGKEEEIINNLEEIKSKKIGVTNSDLSHISYYFTQEGVKLEQFASLEGMLNSINELDYVIVPLNVSLDLILKSNLEINYHFSDIKQYYYLKVDNDQTINSIFQKFYNVWEKNNFSDNYSNHLFKTFINGLELG